MMPNKITGAKAGWLRQLPIRAPGPPASFSLAVDVAAHAHRSHQFMNTKIDIKSALIGLLLGVLATAGIAAASSSAQAGRYQIAGTGSYGLVLDTATGQVWTMFFSSSGGRTDGDAFYQPKAGRTK